jgi:formate/nitrite transporter FocA (FNT family)
MYKNGSIWSGILIGLAGWIFVSVGGGLLGSILFAIGLLCVVLFGSFLYTGKAGSWNFRPFTFRQDVWGLVKVLLGNIIGCGIIGVIAIMSGTLETNETLTGIIQSRESHDAFQTIARGIGCGILMELAVWSYREKGTVLGVLFCVPAFIMSGFYHSVADAFYYIAAYDRLDIWALWIYPLTVIGNFIGCSFRRLFFQTLIH